jgi:hypothetical protein
MMRSLWLTCLSYSAWLLITNMRTIIFAIFLCAFPTLAQTNQPITFAVLLSKDNAPLMTNATYRSTFGNRAMFVSGTDLRGFDVSILQSNELARIGVDPERAKQIQMAHSLATAQLNAQQAVIAQSNLVAAQARQAELNRQQAEAAARQRAYLDSLPASSIPAGPYGSMGFHSGKH